MIKVMRMCSIDNCGRKHYGHDWCEMHYKRWQRVGDPRGSTVMRGGDAGRFRSFYDVDPITGCHLWTKYIDRDGYSRFWAQGKKWYAHVWAWTQKNGPVPEGEELDHFKCDTRWCVNDEHVRPATHRENLLRSNSNIASVNAAKEACDDGHAFDDENTYWHDGKRRCRKCAARYAREQRARQKAAQAVA